RSETSMSEPQGSRGLSRRAVLKSASACAGAAAVSSLTGSLSSVAWSAQSPSVTATTEAGPVRGLVIDKVHSFKGIRYGADTAARRFMPALAPTSWKGVQDATQYGPASPQTGKDEGATSEDCLLLNIWTPGLRDGAK